MPNIIFTWLFWNLALICLGVYVLLLIVFWLIEGVKQWLKK